MILNENIGSYGMFSRAGRISTEKFHILMKKDEILSGISHKVKLPDIMSPKDDSDAENNDIDNFTDNQNQIFSYDKGFNVTKHPAKQKKHLSKKNNE